MRLSNIALILVGVLGVGLLYLLVQGLDTVFFEKEFSTLLTFVYLALWSMDPLFQLIIALVLLGSWGAGIYLFLTKTNLSLSKVLLNLGLGLFLLLLILMNLGLTLSLGFNFDHSLFFILAYLWTTGSILLLNLDKKTFIPSST